MAEIRGYTCDGGCGATTMLDQAHDLVTRNGWFHVLTPPGSESPYFCSLPCLIRWANRTAGDALGRELQR